ITLGIIAILFLSILKSFVVGSLTENTTEVNENLLRSTVEYIPNSPSLLSKLAETEISGNNIDFESAETHISQAIDFSPNNYNYRLLLAQIR
ncbi:tetratricopeptide repeat protein, partial [Streptomyces sp. URMC 126]|uniref:tetratricopeptide repeat protein n=1 Tax=Streptomyces sp. URMC 126 TaxID=3423401 RepID=UPI003F1991D0